MHRPAVFVVTPFPNTNAGENPVTSDVPDSVPHQSIRSQAPRRARRKPNFLEISFLTSLMAAFGLHTVLNCF